MANSERSCPTNDDGLAIQLDAFSHEVLLKKEIRREEYDEIKPIKKDEKELLVKDFTNILKPKETLEFMRFLLE